jgi:hypothetical protein
MVDFTVFIAMASAIARPFGFCLRDIYEQWYISKGRKEVRDDLREVHDLTQRVEATTERLNRANADAEAARLRSRPK